MGIPDYMRSVSRAVPSASAEPVMSNPVISGAPEKVSSERPPPAAIQGNSPPENQGPTLTPFEQRRQAFTQANPQQVEQTMRDVGAVRPEAQVNPERMQQFQQNVSDPYQRFLSDYMKSADNPEVARDRLMKAVEQMQMDDAKKDMNVLKFLPKNKMSFESTNDITNMAQKMGIAPIDVRTIMFTKGDWGRITKKYGYSDTVVKVVKTAFGGE